MFSGIIDHCGTILALDAGVDSLRAVIQCRFEGIEEGESIAVDGVCLTAVEPIKHRFACDISAETLKLTTAGHFAEGKEVNLERSLRLGDRVGGHWVEYA